MLVDGRARPKRHAVAAGERIVGRRAAGARRSAEVPDAAVRDRLGGRAPARRRQARRRRRAPGRGPPAPARSCRRSPGRVAGGDDPERPGVVHRLDRDTSGLLLLARSDAVHAALQAALRAREIERTYLALVEGRPGARRGTIDAPLGRDRRVRTRMSTDTDDPRDAVTHFEVERNLPRGDAAARAPGDRPHAPDPRAPEGDRPPRARRPGVRRAGLRAARASSCTPPSCRSRIRSRASGSRSPPSCRRTSPKRSKA